MNIRWDNRCGHEESIFILGNRYKEVLIDLCNEQPVSIEEILHILGNPLKLSVIKLFVKHGRLTLSDISRLAHVSTSTAYDLINTFYDNNIIRESIKNNNKVYYCLNNGILKSSINTYTELINSITFKEESTNENTKNN